MNEENVNIENTISQPQKSGNKGLLVINVILLIAVAILYVLFFMNCNISCKTQAITEQDAAKSSKPVSTVPVTVAFINTDTIIANYQYAKDLEKELLSLKTTLEKNFESKARSLQSDYENYLKTGATLTLSEQKKKEESFKQRQQELGKMQESMMMQIQQKQVTENTKLINAIYAFIKDYNQKNGKFTVILKKSFMESPVLYIDENLDLTKEILDGLNKEYAEVKEVKK